MIRRRVAGIAACGQLGVSGSELLGIAVLNCRLHCVHRLLYRRVDKLADGQPLKPRLRLDDGRESAADFNKRILGERPILHAASKAELGVAWLDQRVHHVAERHSVRRRFGSAGTCCRGRRFALYGLRRSHAGQGGDHRDDSDQ